MLHDLAQFSVPDDDKAHIGAGLRDLIEDIREPQWILLRREPADEADDEALIGRAERAPRGGAIGAVREIDAHRNQAQARRPADAARRAHGRIPARSPA